MVLQTAGYAGTAAIGGVALRRPGNENDAEKVLTGAPMTRGYKPSIPSAMFQATRGQAYMPSMLADVEVMLLHPCVVAPYLYYRAAIASVKFKIKASSSAVGEFVLAELQKFWSRCLTAVQDAYDYGWIAGELSYQYDKGLLGLYSLETFHPLDCWALTVEENYVGVSVQNIPGAAGRQSLWGPDKYPAKGFWYAHNRRWDRYYGRSQLYGAWRPWRRLGFRDGAEEVIDAGVYRFAYRGPIMRYPVRSFARADGTIDYDGAQSKAREFVENAKAGASVALPNTRDEKGNYEWEIDWPDHTINVQSLVEYAKYLEAQISLGIGVPMELLQAADTGSGWSGRKVPMLGFYQGQKRNANAKVTAWKWQIGDPLVAWNFGPDAWFEVGTELVLPGAMSEEGQPPPGGGMPPPPPGGGGNPLAGLMGGGGGEQGGEMSTLGDGNVNSLYVHAMQSYRRTAQTQRKAIELGYTLADEPKQPRYRAARSRSGGLKAINVSDPTDVKYGEEARKVLSGGGGKKAVEKARRKEAAGQETMRRAVKEEEKPAEKKGGPEAEAKARQLRQEAQKRARAGKPQQAKELLRRAKEESEGAGVEDQQFEREVDQDLEDRRAQEQEQEQKQQERIESRKRMRAADQGRVMRNKARKRRSKTRQAIKKVGELAAAAVRKAQKFGSSLPDKAKETFREQYRMASPEQRQQMKSTAQWSSFIWNLLPGNFVSKIAGEVANQKQAQREEEAAHEAILRRATRKKSMDSDEPEEVDEESLRKKSSNMAEVMFEWMDTAVEVVTSGLDAMVEKIPVLGPLIGAATNSIVPMGSLAFLGYTAVTNPLALAKAAWATIWRTTAKDKEDDQQWKDMERERQAHGTMMATESEGRLYPGLRHRIQELFEGSKSPEWVMALFFAASDKMGNDPTKALELVEKILEADPKPNHQDMKADLDLASWFGVAPDEDEGEEDDEDEVDADEDSAELGSLVADSLWVLTMPDLTTDAELHDLQRRLKTASPETRGKVNQGVRKILG